MKSGQLFWGFLLLTIGALFLLTKYDLLISDFSFVWDIWPLLFVIWGGMVIFKNALVRPMLSSLLGIFLALMIFGMLSNIFGNFSISVDNHDYYTDNYAADYNDSIKYAELDFHSGAGTFEFAGATDKLIEGNSYGSMAEYSFICDREDSTANIQFDLNKSHFTLSDGKLKNHLELKLNENPIWDFNFEFGAAKAKFDLSNYKVRNVNISTGAANVNLRLGNKYHNTNVEVNMGVTSLRIYIPENSGCRIKGDMVLMSRSFEGFKKIKSGYYETANYDLAKEKIDINVDGGVSSLKVIKY